MRAIAIALVLLCKVWVVFIPDSPTPLSFWGGVDVFLALSGFLIARQLFKITADDWRGRGVFVLHRVFRLAPAGLLWLGISAGIYAALAPSYFKTELAAGLRTHLAATGLFSNIYWGLCANDPSTGCAAPPVAGVFWSLSLEWQFYLFAALVLPILGHRKALVAAVLALPVLIESQLLRGHSPDARIVHLQRRHWPVGGNGLDLFAIS